MICNGVFAHVVTEPPDSVSRTFLNKEIALLSIGM